MLKSKPLCWILLTLLLNCGVVSAAQEDKPQTAVVPVRGRSAAKLAATVGQALRDGKTRVAISADPEANVLVVRGNATEVKETTTLLRTLDQPPAMITIEVEISVKSPDDGSSRMIDKVRLTTLENKAAKVQLGQQVAVPTGSTRSFGGRGTQVSMQNQQFGTILEAVAVDGPDGITIDLTVEKSWLEPARDSKDLTGSSKFVLTSQSTIRVADGKSHKIAVSASSGVSTREAIIEVSAVSDSSRGGRTSRDVGSNAAQRLPGRSDRSRGRSSSARGPFGRGGNPSPTNVDGMAARMFSYLDSDKDGKVSKSERERAGQLLKTLGLGDAEEVSRDLFFEKVRSKYAGAVRQNAERRGRQGSDKPKRDNPDGEK